MGEKFFYSLFYDVLLTLNAPMFLSLLNNINIYLKEYLYLLLDNINTVDKLNKTIFIMYLSYL